VPLFAADALADRAESWLENRPVRVIISDFGQAEFVAALGRKVRSRALTEADAVAAIENFGHWTATSCQRVHVASGDIAQATFWLRQFDLNLRAPDAIHLATAHRLGAELATFDAGMAAAARRLGVVLALP
jgi:predicted nucleic acid-binding protein